MRMKDRRRVGSASLELTLATAITVPLGVLLLLLSIQMGRYVFRGLAGMLTMPFL